MNNDSEHVKNLFNLTSKQDRYFLGRAPSLKNISKEILNFENFMNEEKINERRVNMGEVYSRNNEIIGYNSFIVMQNAMATAYEKKFMDMGSKLNYIYSKKILVRSDFRLQGIGTEFVKRNLDLAKKLNKHYILDIERNNYNMINILNQYEFQEDFNWNDSRGRNMIRFFHE